LQQKDLQFVNDVLRPWESLNAFLVERYAFQPNLSDITNQVRGLSVSIKHQVDLIADEQTNLTIKQHQEAANRERQAARIVSDLADSLKHGKLKDQSRQCDLKVVAHFECNEEEMFRFLRNVPEVTHASLGQHDFLVLSLDAMRYWVRARNLQVDVGALKVQEAENTFFPTAHLAFNEAYCIQANSVRIKFFARDNQGVLVPYNPQNVNISIN
jgi:hypothetical protein